MLKFPINSYWKGGSWNRLLMSVTNNISYNHINVFLKKEKLNGNRSKNKKFIKFYWV